MLYLYAIAKNRRGLSVAGPGIRGAAVEILPLRKIVAVASLLDSHDVAVTEANLWRHEQVIARVMEEAAVIPLRFGTVVDEWARCRRRLSECYRPLTTRLTLLSNRVEFAVRLVGGTVEDEPTQTEVSDVPPGPGTAYLRSLAKAHSGWPGWLGTALRRAIDPQAVASTLWPRDSSSQDLRASFLVNRSETDVFRDAVAAFQAEWPGIRLSCTGPWPPYTFANEPFTPLSDEKRYS